MERKIMHLSGICSEKLKYTGLIVLIVLACCACGDKAEETMADSAAVEIVTQEESAGSAGDGKIDAEQSADSAEDIENGDGEGTGGDPSDVGADASAVDKNGVQAEAARKRPPVKVKGIYVSGPVAGIDKMDGLIALVDETELNAMVIDIKNDEGRVTYKMQTGKVLEIDAGIRYISDIEGLIAKCKEKNIYLIARIAAFRDPYLAEQKPELAVKTQSGEVFRDKDGLAWVNPYKREVWEYLAEIAAEAIKIGFDEVQFDYIRFSTDIGEQEADYGAEAAHVSKIDIITEFTEYLYSELSPLGAYVAADVFGTVIDNETDQEIVGQDYVRMASHLDYICPMLYPSHYYSGSFGIDVPDAEPYQTIYEAASSSVKALSALPEEERATVRVWLQSFTAGWVPGHIDYGAEQIRAQIKGAYNAGYDEWILWNASVNYQPEAFLTEEEAQAERERWELEKNSQAVVSGNDAVYQY